MFLGWQHSVVCWPCCWLCGDVGSFVDLHQGCWHPPHLLYCLAVPQCTPISIEAQPANPFKGPLALGYPSYQHDH